MALHDAESCEQLAKTIGWELPHDTIIVQWRLFMTDKLLGDPTFFSKQLSLYREEYHRDWEMEDELHIVGQARDRGR